MNSKDSLTKNLRDQVFQGLTRTAGWRQLQLKRLSDLLEEHEDEVIEALSSDLAKPPTEAIFEIIAIRQELKLAQEKLKEWMRPKRIRTPISLKPGMSWIQNEPLGCILIIGPWNYPFSLTIQPLVSALAAGNTAVLKPSENAPATSKLISKIINKHMPSNVVKVVEGDGEVASALLKESFDHIFFTGGGEIGKKVMTAAAERLVPVTLELGGKSPAIVIGGADLSTTARRLIWGKGLNAGQTCIAPNHLLVQTDLLEPLLKELKKELHSLYGVNPIESSDLGKIVNDYHFKRLSSLLKSSLDKCQVLLGGQIDKNQRKIAPTLIKLTESKDPLLKDELFGPILPILSVSNLNEAIDLIRSQPKPLAIYMFGGSKEEKTSLLERTNSGGVCFDDLVIQAGIPELPFGGVGLSGTGSYHGKAGFEVFSHLKSVLNRPFWLDINFRYPPYKLDISFINNLIR